MKYILTKIKRYKIYTVIINEMIFDTVTRKTLKYEIIRRVKTTGSKKQLLKDCLFAIMDGIEQLEYKYKLIKRKNTIIEYHNDDIIYRKITIK